MAVDLFKKIASNGVEFHKGHSDLIELLWQDRRRFASLVIRTTLPPE
jgi:hypothetical protein